MTLTVVITNPDPISLPEGEDYPGLDRQFWPSEPSRGPRFKALYTLKGVDQEDRRVRRRNAYIGAKVADALDQEGSEVVDVAAAAIDARDHFDANVADVHDWEAWTGSATIASGVKMAEGIIEGGHQSAAIIIDRDQSTVVWTSWSGATPAGLELDPGLGGG